MMRIAQPLAQLEAPLSAPDFARFVRLSTRLPLTWTGTPRRRRVLFLVLAAPGFAGVFSTPFHQSLALLLAGFLLFAAALAFRRRTEPVFVRAEAAALWPPPPRPSLQER